MSDRPWAILPVKDLGQAKQRLRSVLAPEERRALFRAMLGDVLACLARCAELTGLLVVTRDPEAGALARDCGARVLGEPANRGQSPAVMLACRILAADGATSMVALPADVPLVRPGDIAALIASCRAPPAVSLVPARDRLGTNAVLCAPPDVLAFGFGTDSFRRHQRRTRALGIEPAIVHLPRLALDVDTPDDLSALLAEPPATRAHQYLHESGIAARLGRSE